MKLQFARKPRLLLFQARIATTFFCLSQRCAVHTAACCMRFFCNGMSGWTHFLGLLVNIWISVNCHVSRRELTLLFTTSAASKFAASLQLIFLSSATLSKLSCEHDIDCFWVHWSETEECKKSIVKFDFLRISAFDNIFHAQAACGRHPLSANLTPQCIKDLNSFDGWQTKDGCEGSPMCVWVPQALLQLMDVSRMDAIVVGFVIKCATSV